MHAKVGKRTLAGIVEGAILRNLLAWTLILGCKNPLRETQVRG